jgi:Raf kinase inhibitor-like YbhB/YbcL family protein
MKAILLEVDMTFRISSPAFGDGEFIPRKFSCLGSDISPALQWEGQPTGTRSFALILHDPDAPAGDWMHWLVYNMPAQKHSLVEAFPTDKTSVDGTLQGQNSWHQVKYGGPCPPSGTHRYYFRLYALDVLLPLTPGVNRKELEQAMQGHILAESVLMGKFSKEK